MIEYLGKLSALISRLNFYLAHVHHGKKLIRNILYSY